MEGRWKVLVGIPISLNQHYHPKVDRIYGLYKACTRVLSTIIFHLLQDGCILKWKDTGLHRVIAALLSDRPSAFHGKSQLDTD